MNEAKPEPDKAGRGLDGGYKASVLEAQFIPLTVTADHGAGPVDVSEQVRAVEIGERWEWPGDGVGRSWHELTLHLRGAWAEWCGVRRVAVRRGDGPWLLAVVTERAEVPDGVTVQGAGSYV